VPLDRQGFSYLLVSWPVLAFCCSHVFVSARRIARFYYAIPGLIPAVIGVVGLVGSFWIRLLPLAVDGIATPATGWTILTAFEPFPADLWRGLEGFLWISSDAALVAGLPIVYFGWRKQVVPILAVLAILMGVVFAMGAQAMVLVQDEFSSAKVARIIETAASGAGSVSPKVSDFRSAAVGPSSDGSVNRSVRPDYEVICAFESNDLTSLFFYLPHRIFLGKCTPRDRVCHAGAEHRKRTLSRRRASAGALARSRTGFPDRKIREFGPLETGAYTERCEFVSDWEMCFPSDSYESSHALARVRCRAGCLPT
jgi:hypothetical protein